MSASQSPPRSPAPAPASEEAAPVSAAADRSGHAAPAGEVREPRWQAAVRLALLAASAALLVWHSLRYDFVTDDAYISFVYARNLAEHSELTFNLGDYVEGYSNFSWTVLLGGLMALGIGPELSSRVLGTLCGALVLLGVARLTRRALGARAAMWPALPPALLAASAGFACWSSGGLETQLFTLLCVAALDRFAAACEAASSPPVGRRRWLQLGALLALAAMTRPEGLLLTAVLAGCAVVRHLAQRRAARRAGAPALAPPTTRRQQLAGILPPPAQLAALGVFFALWAPWFAWRCWYYGWPFPNTYYVKAHGPWQPPALAAQMWSNGLYYLGVWLKQTGLVWAWPLALVGLVAARPHTARFAHTAPMALFAVAYLGYTASVGGDFMGLHRFIMPVFAIAAVAVALGLQRLGEVLGEPLGGRGGGGRARRRWAMLGVALALWGAFALGQQRLTERSTRWGRFEADRGIDPPAFLMVYTRDRAEIGKALRGCLRPDDFSIVGGAGAQPYFARMRAIDVFGLVSEDVAHREPRIRARAGHTKFASEALLMETRPTFLFSCYALHPTPTPPSLPCAGSWLGRGFEVVTLHVPALRQSGTYYSFLARRDRQLQCPGLQR